jgi:hypothetical protein
LDSSLHFQSRESQLELLNLVERADEEMEIGGRLGMFAKPKETKTKDRSVVKNVLIRGREREIEKLRKAQREQEQQLYEQQQQQKHK